MNDITNEIMRNKREIEALKAKQSLPTGALKLFTYTITFDLVEYNDYLIRNANVCFQSSDGTTPVVSWGVNAQEHNIPWYGLNKIYDKPMIYSAIYSGDTDKTYLKISYGFPFGTSSTATSTTITFTVQVTSTVEGVLSVELE